MASSSQLSHTGSTVKEEEPNTTEVVRTESKADVEKIIVPTSGPPDFPEGGLRAWLTVLGGYVNTHLTDILQ